MKGLTCSVRYRPLHPAHPLNHLPPPQSIHPHNRPTLPPPHMQPAPFPQHRPSTYHTVPLPPILHHSPPPPSSHHLFLLRSSLYFSLFTHRLPFSPSHLLISPPSTPLKTPLKTPQLPSQLLPVPSFLLHPPKLLSLNSPSPSPLHAFLAALVS